MTQASTILDVNLQHAARRNFLAAYLELTKARLSAMVVVTAAAGYAVASAGAMDWLGLLWIVIGTGLCAGSANAFNQIIEVRRDALMNRTKGRPLPAGDLSSAHAFVFAVLIGYVGVSMLAMLLNLLTAGLALANILIYVLLYTPLKIRTTLNTLVGAVCGAIPPMMGWAAATGTLGHGAWVLGAILFLWQIPHFLALAWMYRDDYSRGGYVMLPQVDPAGVLTAQVAVLTSLALLPLGLVATVAGLAGWVYALASIVLAAGMILLAVRLWKDRSDASARRLFLASITYLPLLLLVMVLDRGTIGGRVMMLEQAGESGSLVARAD